jgi:hypothetical protein
VGAGVVVLSALAFSRFWLTKGTSAWLLSMEPFCRTQRS